MISTKRRATELLPLSASEVAKVSGGTKPKTSAEKPSYYKITLQDVLISGYGSD